MHSIRTISSGSTPKQTHIKCECVCVCEYVGAHCSGMCESVSVVVCLCLHFIVCLLSLQHHQLHRTAVGNKLFDSLLLFCECLLCLDVFVFVLSTIVYVLCHYYFYSCHQQHLIICIFTIFLLLLFLLARLFCWLPVGWLELFFPE